MGKNIIKGLSITFSVFIYLFGSLTPSYADKSPWPLFLAAINAAKNDRTPLPPGTVISAGQVWMDRNLGASRVATSSKDSAAYGDLYQWGRGTDGHEKRTSSTTTTLSTTDIPGHGSFILAINYPHDWRIPQKDNLWQGVSGTNNPCPSGFRLPTDVELDTERLSWNSYDSAGAYASPLKLVVAGIRNYGVGILQVVDYYGAYWSSTVVGTVASRSLHFYSTEASMLNAARGDSYSVRCIKD